MSRTRFADADLVGSVRSMRPKCSSRLDERLKPRTNSQKHPSGTGTIAFISLELATGAPRVR